MGSSCSSRQSGKDTASLRSEDSQDEKPNKDARANSNAEGKGGPRAPSAAQNKGGGLRIQNEFSSGGDEGTSAGMLTPSTIAGMNSSKTSGLELKEALEASPLSILDKETRSLVEGRFEDETQPAIKPSYSICLLGDTEDSSGELNQVENLLNGGLITKLRKEGRDIFVMNPQTSVPVVRSPYFVSDLVTSFLIDQCKISTVFVILYSKSNFFIPELPTLIQKSHFESILTSLSENADKELLRKWYVEDEHFKPPAFKLNLPPDYLSGLMSDNKGQFGKVYRSFSADYRHVVACFRGVGEDLKSPVLKHLLVKEFSQMKHVADIRFKLFIRNDENSNSEIESSTLENAFQKSGGNTILQISKEESPVAVMVREIEECVNKCVDQHIASAAKLKKGVKKSLLKEMELHRDFCRHVTRRGSFPWTHSWLDRLKEYVTGEGCSKPLLVSGRPGSGKTLLAALTALNASKWNPTIQCVVRFVGLTESSVSLEGILYYLYEQVVILSGDSPEVTGAKSGRKRLEELLTKGKPQNLLLIVIDGIDELDQEGFLECFDWAFTNTLPPNLKLVFTLQHNSNFHQQLQLKVDSPDNVLEVTLGCEAKATFAEGFEDLALHYDVSSAWNRLQKASDSLTPLYLMVISELSLLSNSVEEIPVSLEESVQLFFRVLKNIFPKEMLSMVLGCLSCTSVGLSQSEIIAIIKSSTLNTSGHSLDWIFLWKHLRSLLLVRFENDVTLISWCSQYVRSVASAVFLDSAEQKLKCQEMFRKVVANEEARKIYVPSLWKLDDSSFSHIRMLQESSALLKMSIRKETYHFFDYVWLLEKIRWSRPFQLVTEMNEALKQTYSKEVRLLRDAILLSIPALIYDFRQLYLQLSGRLKWHLQADEHCPKLKGLLEFVAKSHHTRLIPLSPCLDFQQEGEVDEERKANFDRIFRIPNNDHHVITISASRSQVTVWNIMEMTIVRTLKGINEPRNLEMIDDTRCLLLCGRELRIYDLNEGKLVMKLREVMNQKTPFFGLHDCDHVVALSRSRMYVNMMNLTEGKCVTTFKVGEDRFLNSLMVSENGKVCVCGDDSQKPSALLVWDLQSRKLMYDLRIPHHQFSTNLAAITTEGHYVCCVCKEVEDPAPNFIVVYDLQSGTLFKRWKPDVNSISIAISTAGTCVTVGLQDSSIMAYDLITGNPRWTVRGHSNPADTFKMDKQGSVLLSYDSSRTDSSLRVWDIQTGESLAVFTPDRSITACEITDGKVVVVAIEGQETPSSFVLRRKGEEVGPAATSCRPFGVEELEGKVFELGEE